MKEGTVEYLVPGTESGFGNLSVSDGSLHRVFRLSMSV